MSFLDRENTVAPLNYNRWLVPPAALAIHMCIGQVYGFSVFKKPLTQLLGVTTQTPQDWNQEQIAVDLQHRHRCVRDCQRRFWVHGRSGMDLAR